MDVRYKVLVENLSYRGIKLDVSKKFINGERFCPLLALMIEKNRLGRKTGRGWYRYEKPGAKFLTMMMKLLILLKNIAKVVLLNHAKYLRRY